MCIPAIRHRVKNNKLPHFIGRKERRRGGAVTAFFSSFFHIYLNIFPGIWTTYLIYVTGEVQADTFRIAVHGACKRTVWIVMRAGQTLKNEQIRNLWQCCIRWLVYMNRVKWMLPQMRRLHRISSMACVCLCMSFPPLTTVFKYLQTM